MSPGRFKGVRGVKRGLRREAPQEPTSEGDYIAPEGLKLDDLKNRQLKPALMRSIERGAY